MFKFIFFIKNRDEGVIMSGEFVEDVAQGDEGKVNRLGRYFLTMFFINIFLGSRCPTFNLRRWYKPWFYKHVESFMSSEDALVEYIPTVDFYHRHNKSYFW